MVSLLDVGPRNFPYLFFSTSSLYFIIKFYTKCHIYFVPFFFLGFFHPFRIFNHDQNHQHSGGARLDKNF